MKVHEFNQDDDELNIDITQEKPGDFVTAVKKILKGDMSDKLMSTIQSLGKAMRGKDADEIKLRKD